MTSTNVPSMAQCRAGRFTIMACFLILLCSGIIRATLIDDRMAVLAIWAERTNVDQAYLRSVYDAYATDDTLANGTINPYIHTFTIDKMGSFVGKEECREYAVLAADPSWVQINATLDLASVDWLDANKVAYRTVNNYSINFVPGRPRFDGFVNMQLVGFQPGTAKVALDYSRQDPLVVRYFQGTQGVLPPSDICTVIMASCTGANQVYISYAQCLNYLNAVLARPKICPSNYLGNDTGCYAFHAQAATVLPAIHCRHVFPGATTPRCRDLCVEDGPCGSCHPDAKCVFASPFGQVIPEYACQCKDGYTGDGTVSCVPNTCAANSTAGCPSKSAYASCTAGLCGCQSLSGFLWNTTHAARLSNATCQCDADEELSVHAGQPECMPVGRCREVWQCPQAPTQLTSIRCATYGNNSAIPYSSCLCNYGYENLGFSYPCECPSPRREGWNPATARTVCLAPAECTAAGPCASGLTCTVISADGIGSCA